MSFRKLITCGIFVAWAALAGAGPAVFDAALTVNGNLTITGGSLRATSATTADGASIILGSTNAQIIFDEDLLANIVRGVARYKVVSETMQNANSTYVAYALTKILGVMIFIR